MFKYISDMQTQNHVSGVNTPTNWLSAQLLLLFFKLIYFMFKYLLFCNEAKWSICFHLF